MDGQESLEFMRIVIKASEAGRNSFAISYKLEGF